MPRRKRHNTDLPRNLYRSKKAGRFYYRYLRPDTGKETGLGSDKATACEAARQLNMRFSATPSVGHLIARVIADHMTMAKFTERYYAIVTSRPTPLADNTLRTLRSHLKHIRENLGQKALGDVTVADCAGFIESFRAADKLRTAQALRSTLKEVFNEAIREGILTANPADVTRAVTATVKRDRLTLERFNIILEHARRQDPWAANAMLLALLTGQRVSDVAAMRFKDIEDGYLYVIQKKTGNPVRLSLKLRLDVLGVSLGDVVSQCRDIVVSPFLIHHSKGRTYSKRGDAVHEQTISKGFKRARDAANLEWKNQPATFNEIRSLSGRLYKEQGVDPQSLLGHKDAATTAIYLDNRKVEWVTVDAAAKG